MVIHGPRPLKRKNPLTSRTRRPGRELEAISLTLSLSALFNESNPKFAAATPFSDDRKSCCAFSKSRARFRRADRGFGACLPSRLLNLRFYNCRRTIYTPAIETDIQSGLREPKGSTSTVRGNENREVETFIKSSVRIAVCSIRVKGVSPHSLR